MYYSLTVREHLELFVVLKGVPEPHSVAVEATLQALNLTGRMFTSEDMKYLFDFYIGKAL